jgi:glyceraldehyde 3-phosphate dehydrogenase
MKKNKKIKIALNGFGRIGRIFFRQAFEIPEFEIVAINDLGELENLAYLLKYDTIYRTYQKEISFDQEKGCLLVAGKSIKFFQEKDPKKLPWRDLKIDLVVEATGVFETYEKAQSHLKAGAKRVVISAPAKDEDGLLGETVLIGINEKEGRKVFITSNGSCTTNAASPVIQIMNENPGIKKALLNTVHAYTATQSLVDGQVKGKDLRRGRAAAQNIIPATTGAAIAVTRAIPELIGKFDGIAIRVPVIGGSLADITFLAKRETSVEEINSIFKEAEKQPRWQGILKTVEEPIVSSDILGDPYPAIVDLSFTKVVDKDLVKVLSWYDNEWGYCASLIKHIQRINF